MELCETENILYGEKHHHLNKAEYSELGNVFTKYTLNRWLICKISRELNETEYQENKHNNKNGRGKEI